MTRNTDEPERIESSSSFREHSSARHPNARGWKPRQGFDRSLIDWHIVSGTSAIVVMGSTGEAATVSMEEHEELIRAAVAHAQGTDSDNRGDRRELDKRGDRAAPRCLAMPAPSGALVVHCYNKPTAGRSLMHITRPSRRPSISRSFSTTFRGERSRSSPTRPFFALPNFDIVGLKDATGDIGRGVMLMRGLPESFAVYSGDDPSAAALMLLGARGNISVTANVIPITMARLCTAARAGDIATVRAISRKIAPLHEAMFVESNPIPVKWALEQLGKLSASYRLPMTPLSEWRHVEVANALRLAAGEE